jgi:uncharacterized protein YmfQ (DUF2313 family)
MFKVFQHVLPNARAWRLTADKKLRQFFVGLGNAAQEVRTFFDLILDDLYPSTTRALDEWEEQFGLPDTGLTEPMRRERLDAAWKALGGQSPRYIQDTLQNNGFNVYVHEWWDSADQPAIGDHTCVVPRNPLMYLRRCTSPLVSMVDCGEPLAECGEPSAECGNGFEPPGYPLVNKVFSSQRDSEILCGEPLAECGEPLAECDNYMGYVIVGREYLIPLDPEKWAYFFYIGGETFGTLAVVDQKRKDEFEALCLKICPTQLWLGILVEYS